MSEFLASAHERLAGASGLADRWQQLTALMAGAGADQVNYAVLDTLNHDRANAPVMQLSTMDPGWIAHYLDARLDLADPHVRFVRQRGLRPYRFHAGMADALDNPQEADVIRQAAEAGLRSQISVIAPDPLGGTEPIGGMSIGSSLAADTFAAATRDKELALISTAMLFHNLSIGEIRRSQAGAQPLTARERDCLTLLANGLRTSRIAERLAISDATVELHLRNARRKLKARNSAQAVARGLLFGDIQL